MSQINKHLEEANQLNHSGDLEDMLGRTPGWLLKSGMTMIGAASLLIISMSWLIKYPDQITGVAIIQTSNPPIEVFASISSIVDSVFANNGHWVEKGDNLILIENTADLEDIKKAISFCEQIQQTHEWINFLEIAQPGILQLGEVQDEYASLEEKLKLFQRLLQNKHVKYQIDALESEKGYLSELNNSLQERVKLYQKELTLIEEDLFRAEELATEGVISQVELEKKQSLFLQGSRQAKRMVGEQIQNHIRIEQLKSKQLDLKEGLKKELYAVHQSLTNHLQQCQASLFEWEKENLLVAPISGFVSLSDDVVDGGFVKNTTPILTVVPDLKQNTVIAQIEVPALGIGKIKPGNVIQISLAAYPAEEYGLLETKVSSISKLPKERIAQQSFTYLVKAKMSLPLTTSYNKVLLFQQKMMGEAKVITEKRRLLNRLLDRIFHYI